MDNLDHIDLEILYQAKNGTSPEKLNQKEIFSLGIWELVDKFASLQEKNLLIKNKKLFVLTKTGIDTFWHIETPLWKNLLKLLQIKSFSDVQCARYLEESLPATQQALDMIRKKGFVLISPLRKEGRLLKMFEILPEGVDEISQSKKNDVFVVKSGNKLIVEFDNGEGILYEIIDDLINPLRMIKTLRKDEIKDYK